MSAIIERPILNSIRLQTFNIINPGALFLDYSRLDVATLGNGTETLEDQWIDWTPNIVQISTAQGGTQDGIAIRNDTGVLTARLRNVPISTNTPVFITGQPLRLQHISGLGIATTIYTGRILDVIAGNTLDGIGKITPVIELNAVDNYVNHDQTTRYGAMPPTGSETFTQRIARLTQTATAPIEPPVLNREPTYTPWAERRRNRCAQPSFEVANSLWNFSGNASGAPSTDWSAFGDRSMKVTAGSTNRASGDVRYGSLTSFPDGMAVGGTYTVSAYINTPAAHLSLDSSGGSRQRRMLVFLGSGAGGTAVTQTFGRQAPNAAGVHRVSHTFTIPPGTTGVIIAVGCAGSPSEPAFVTYVDGVQQEDGADLTDYLDGSQAPAGELERTRWIGTPDASASVLESREFAGWSPLPDTDAILGRTVYESSLANHFTLACNTVGAMWWVGADGVTRFGPREYDPYNPVIFLGLQPPSHPDGALHYIRPTASGGSAGFFNRALMHNHGAAIDPDSGDWVADDTDVTTTNLGGIFGFSDAEVDTNHADLNAHDAPVRFYRWLVPTMSFGAKATSITWNAQENLERIPDLEIGRSVYLPTDYLDRDPWPWNVTIGIRHTITPTRWMVELTLIGVANP